MKKSRYIQAVLILLCIVLLCCTPAHAVENRASGQIDLSAVTLTKTSSGNLNVYFMVQGNTKMDVIGANKIEIQRSTITGWVTEYTFTVSTAPSMLTTNSTRHSAAYAYTPLFPGKSYRAVATLYAENDSGSTTLTSISKTV